MTRIIAGRFGGRRLATPPGAGTRPTSDRVREALFSSLEASFGGLDGLAVVDLYAGSGALGLEAASRGARVVTLVEHDRRAADVIRRNVRDLGVDAQVRATTVDAWLASTTDVVDLAFLDPPYALDHDRLEAQLVALLPRLAPDALVVVERSSRTPFAWPDGYAALRDKRYGETHVWQGEPSVGSVP